VFVKPNSARFGRVIDNDEILVFCMGKPVKGKVNRGLLKEFAWLFHSKIEIISGFTYAEEAADKGSWERRSGTASAY
jgi:uncharacterized protein YggU (UPF0235/DUF167 family)